VANGTVTAGARWRVLSRLEPGALAWIAITVLLVAAARFLYVETRGATFWFDEWEWVLGRRESNLDAFLEPHNGHLSLVPIVIYRLLFATFGLDVYGPYRLMVIAAHLGCVALLFLYASRRVGGFSALLAAALLLFLGPAWQNILWPFQVGWLISLGAGLGALLMLDRGDRLGDVTAAILLALALASSGLGVPLAIGLAVDILWGRRRWRDGWIVAAPLALYGLWSLGYQDSRVLGQLVDVPGFAADAMSASISSLLGVAGETVPRERGALFSWGRPLAIVAVVLLVWRLVRLGRIPPRVLTLLAIVLSFWIGAELTRGTFSSAYESRYIYVGGLFVLLVAVELARGVSVSLRAHLLLGAAVTAALVSNIGVLRDGGDYVRKQGQITRAVLGAVEVGRPLLRPNQVVTGLPGYPFVLVETGSYFAAERTAGTPAATVSELATQPWYARREADRELVRIHRITPERSFRHLALGPGPTVDAVAGGTVVDRGPCAAFRPAARSSESVTSDLQVTVPRAGVLLTAEGGAATVAVRRFGDEFRDVGRVAPSAPAAVRIRPDRAGQPWHMRVEPTGRATVCGLA
jgi:hypothetical protein